MSHFILLRFWSLQGTSSHFLACQGSRYGTTSYFLLVRRAHRAFHLLFLHVGEPIGCHISFFFACGGACRARHLIFLHIGHLISFCHVQDRLKGTAFHFLAYKEGCWVLHLVFSTGSALIWALHHVSLQIRETYRALSHVFPTVRAPQRAFHHILFCLKVAIRALHHFPPL